MTTRFVHGLSNFVRRDQQPRVVTVGTFDGIHVGHQEIFRRVRQACEQSGSEAVLVTFHPHPRVLVTPGDAPLLLTTIEEKERFIPDFFDGTVLVLDFDERLMNLEPVDFVKDILVDRIGTGKLIVGYDHAIGKNRSGSIAQLRELGQKFGYDIEVCPPVLMDSAAVSSSRIRRCLLQERFGEAVRLLGHEYAICGPIEKGIGLGRKLGYPTANVGYNRRKLLPPAGVYTCCAEIRGDCHQGVMFIGHNHFNPEKRVSVEAHLFNFDEDIYNRVITVYPLHYIRKNRRFQSPEALVRQIRKDEQKVLQILQKEKADGSDKGAKGSDRCCQSSSR